jgi:hypothetical protein
MTAGRLTALVAAWEIGWERRKSAELEREKGLGLGMEWVKAMVTASDLLREKAKVE